ncbi:RNA-dependent RNA polymerase [Tolypocladium ophioglossoides totivirus 1]|nr:RNA-dependent RNA polymerase [Tolypocladium ophioglossoides totivirus 1]
MCPNQDTELAERAKPFGVLGATLLPYIHRKQFPQDAFNMPISDQMIALLAPTFAGHTWTSTTRVAASLLLGKFPIQVPLTSDEIIGLRAMAFKPRPLDLAAGEGRILALVGGRVRGVTRQLMEAFPLKRHAAASVKVNVYLSEVLETILKLEQESYYDPLVDALAGKVLADQATMAIMYAMALRKHLGGDARQAAYDAVMDPKSAKGLTTALKALGANSDMVGAMFVESECLQGRGVGTTDLLAEASYRCDPVEVSKVVIPEKEGLENVVRTIIREELSGREIKFDSLENFWDQRWRWCVNGSHSRVLDSHMGVDSHGQLPGIDRMYRRMYAEMSRDYPGYGWDGTTYVSTSPKLEAGKTRAIFACDTRSYFAFEHLLSPVSAAWQDKRVLLNPGRLGTLGLALRINRAKSQGGIHAMLDYDDFNSHHSTANMKMLFRVTMEEVGYPVELRQPLLDSFDKMHVSLRGKEIGVMAGTLPSGHRGTTYINSVFNAAYIRHALGEDLYRDISSLHVGDDVYSSCPTHSHASILLDRVGEYGCRMNAAKQSVGSVSAEFLRLAVRPTYATGYFCRALASTVSGNWTSSAKLGPKEFLASICASSRSLQNRGRTTALIPILARAASRVTKLRYRGLVPIIAGEAAIAGGPVFTESSVIRTREYVEGPEERELPSKVRRDWPTHATDSYLATSLKPVEVAALVLTKRSVKSVMLLSSYKKALVDDFSLRGCQLRNVRDRRPVGSASAQDLLFRPDRPGCLEKYPILPYLKGYLTSMQLRELVRLANGDSTASDIRRVAWGEESRSKIIQGVLSYSDAASLSKRTSNSLIYTTFDTYM